MEDTKLFSEKKLDGWRVLNANFPKQQTRKSATKLSYSERKSENPKFKIQPATAHSGWKFEYQKSLNVKSF